MKRSLIAISALMTLCSCGKPAEQPEARPKASSVPMAGTGYRPVRADYEAIVDSMLTNSNVSSSKVEEYAREHGIDVDKERLVRKKRQEKDLVGRPKPVGGAEFLQDEMQAGNTSAQ